MIRQRLNVVGVLLNNQGQVLLTKKPDKRGVYPGSWGLPGGGVDANETINEAFKREMYEETGLKVEELEKLFFNDDRVTKYVSDTKTEEQYLVFLYYKALVSGSVQLNDEREEWMWADVITARGIQLNNKTREVLQKLELV